MYSQSVSIWRCCVCHPGARGNPDGPPGLDPGVRRDDVSAVNAMHMAEVQHASHALTVTQLAHVMQDAHDVEREASPGKLLGLLPAALDQRAS